MHVFLLFYIFFLIIMRHYVHVLLNVVNVKVNVKVNTAKGSLHASGGVREYFTLHVLMQTPI